MKKEFQKILLEEDYLVPSNVELYKEVIKEMIRPFKKIKIDKIVAIDMKGIMYGPTIAKEMRVPFIPLLKGNKIQRRELVERSSFFKDYSGKEKSLEVFKKSIKKGDKILLIDDWFDSGSTGKVAINLIERFGAKVVGISIIRNQLNKKDEEYFKKYNLSFLVRAKAKT